MFKSTVTAIALTLGLTSAAMAQSQNDTIFYFGGGMNNDGATVETDDTPFALGVLSASPDGGLLLGADIALEGEMLDSTFGTDSVRQAFSFNALLGTNLAQSTGMRTDVSVILGLRESFSDCPDSFIGFQCYADQAPETEYEFNYGALLTVSVDAFTFGLRATEVSTQAVVGFSF